MGQWYTADEYDGEVRQITYRTLCNSPMCPPDTAMTEVQHAVLSPDKRTLVGTYICFSIPVYSNVKTLVNLVG